MCSAKQFGLGITVITYIAGSEPLITCVRV